MHGDKLQDHMFATYTHLRVGVAIISFAFPLLLWGGGILLGIPLKDSMSQYYYGAENGHSMRNWFVGILFAVGVILYLYKGYSHRENIALNFAGFFAICIAIFPTELDSGQKGIEITKHGLSAGLFFLSIAYVCIWCAAETLHLMKDEARERQYRIFYRLIGIGLVASPLTALLLAKVLNNLESYVFIAEAVGIWFFSSYWLLKSWEISSTNAERLALSKKIET